MNNRSPSHSHARSQETFRAYVREFLEAYAVPKTEGGSPTEDGINVNRARAFQRSLFDAGLAGISWPKEYGGQGLSAGHQTTFNDEAAEFDLPTTPFSVGFGMCIPTVLAYGTEEQKQRYVPPAIQGEEIWCQLFSEPSAGSDLAGLRSSVVRDGGEWVLNGQKVWTTGAHFSQHAILLARSDPEQPKHAGLSMFILDMNTPGVTVRPLRQMNGQAHFNEVFFDDARIPADRILSEPGDGWRCAITLLMNERVSVSNGSAAKADRLGPVRAHLELAEAKGILGDGAVREEIMDLVVRYWAADLLGVRQRQMTAAGVGPGPEGSLNKLSGAIISKRSAAVAYKIAGLSGAAWMSTDDSGYTASQKLLSVPSLSIAGGSNQICRNILSERVLGLPKEPGIDPRTPFRDLPFS